LREWREQVLNWRRFAFKEQHSWMGELDLNGPRSIPWYRDDYDRARLVDDEEDDADDEDQEDYKHDDDDDEDHYDDDDNDEDDEV
jgi:hypothetical protein